MTTNDYTPKTVCECGDPDCLKGSQTFTLGRGEAQAAQPSEFQREDRYIVIKRKDLGAVPLEVRESLGVALFQLSKHLPKRECLIVESDWPEYETTWAAIQARVTGKGAQAGDEDEKVQRRLQDLIAVARRINKEAFAKGTQKVEHGLFVSLDFALEAYDADMRARASKQGVDQ